MVGPTDERGERYIGNVGKYWQTALNKPVFLKVQKPQVSRRCPLERIEEAQPASKQKWKPSCVESFPCLGNGKQFLK